MKAPLGAKKARLQGAFFIGLQELEMHPVFDIRKDMTDLGDGEGFYENDLKRRVQACLATRFPSLADTEIAVIGRTVIFRGDALSDVEKRLCTECCRHVPGVARVMEKVVVFGGAAGRNQRLEPIPV